MRLFAVTLAIFGIIVTAFAQTTPQRVPQFANFLSPIYRGPLGRVNLSSPNVFQYRTRLRKGAQQPVNFAGHYQLVQWGCGTECSAGAVIDALNGQVTFLPTVVTQGMEAAMDAKFKAIEFRANSRLIVFSGQINETGVLGTHFDLWNGSGFQELLTLPFVPPATEAQQQPGGGGTVLPHDGASQEAPPGISPGLIQSWKDYIKDYPEKLAEFQKDQAARRKDAKEVGFSEVKPGDIKKYYPFLYYLGMGPTTIAESRGKTNLLFEMFTEQASCGSGGCDTDVYADEGTGYKNVFGALTFGPVYVTRTGGQVFLYLYNPNIIQTNYGSLTEEFILKDGQFVENQPPPREPDDPLYLKWRAFEEQHKNGSQKTAPVAGNAQTTLYHPPQTAAEVQLNADLNLDITQTNANYSIVDIMTRNPGLFAPALLLAVNNANAAVANAVCGGNPNATDKGPCNIDADPILCAQDTPPAPILYRTISSSGNTATVAYEWETAGTDWATYTMVYTGGVWQMNAVQCVGIGSPQPVGGGTVLSHKADSPDTPPSSTMTAKERAEACEFEAVGRFPSPVERQAFMKKCTSDEVCDFDVQAFAAEKVRYQNAVPVVFPEPRNTKDVLSSYPFLKKDFAGDDTGTVSVAESRDRNANGDPINLLFVQAGPDGCGSHGCVSSVYVDYGLGYKKAMNDTIIFGLSVYRWGDSGSVSVFISSHGEAGASVVTSEFDLSGATLAPDEFHDACYDRRQAG